MKKEYIDLHTHTLFSDGELIPSELVYRAKMAGYNTIAITDHVDFSNIDFVISSIKKLTANLSKYYRINVICGAEITYVPPALIPRAVRIARNLGAKIVIVHGETTAETVPPGTNRSAILSRADILAHPGFISYEDVKLAVRNNVYLEITTRNGHCRTNRHVYVLAKKAGAKIILNTDTHKIENLMNSNLIKKTLKDSGIDIKLFNDLYNNSKNLVLRVK